MPLHDVWCVELPGGGPGRTIADLRELMDLESLRGESSVLRLLFGLRGLLGRLFRWDAPKEGRASGPSVERLSDEDRRLSLVEPGSPDGPFQVLYVRPSEAVSEIRNATVHAFSAMALEEREDGYRLFWAIYVRPVGRITAFYMALIDPFRRFLVYPAILRRVHRSWLRSVERSRTATGSDRCDDR